MRDFDPQQPSLAGSLLAAHPSLLDPNFNKSVILLSAHSEEDGALGVVINRPMGKTLKDLQSDFAFSPLGEIPLYFGGPVQPEEMILVAWKWAPDETGMKLFFGISAEKAQSLQEDPDVVLRGYLGYSGWSKGQLEGELDDHAWVVSPISAPLLNDTNGKLWRRVLSQTEPELGFLADAPDDPSVN